MRTSIRCLLACLLCAGFQACQLCDDPTLEEFRFELLGDGHIVAGGSWWPHSAGPGASVHIECRREHAECLEIWARLLADEHGIKPDRLATEVTRYRIKTWTVDEIRATGMYRERWPVELIVHPKTREVRRQYLDPRDSHDGEEFWLLR